MEVVPAPDFYSPPLRAWRTWFVVPADLTSGELRLKSFVYRDLWEPGKPFEAECRVGFPYQIPEPHNHAVPDEDHTCGIYALRDRHVVSQKYYHNAGQKAGRHMEIWRVIGEVALWGTIVPGDKGYRAQYAYPTKLEVPKFIKGRERHLTAKEVALALEKYECEVEVTDEVLDLRLPLDRYFNRP